MCAGRTGVPNWVRPPRDHHWPFPQRSGQPSPRLSLQRLGLDQKAPPPANYDWPIPAPTGHVSLAWRALTANDRRRRGENAPSNVPYFELFTGYGVHYGLKGPGFQCPYHVDEVHVRVLRNLTLLNFIHQDI